MVGSAVRSPFVLLTIAAASWGIGTVLSKRALDDFPPLGLLPVQLAASVAVLVLLMRLQGMPLGGSPSLLGRLGILNPGLAYVLGLLGLVTISASLAVLLWAIEPLAILFLAALVLREQVTRTVVALSIVALAGMVLVVYDPASNGQLIGIVLTVAGVACCAIYSIVARRWVGTADSTAQVVLAQQTYALGFVLLAAVGIAVLGGSVWPTTVSAAGVLSAVASGVLYYAAAYWSYLTALRHLPASVASVSFYLVPVFGIAAGQLALGEQFDGSQWIGAATVLIAFLALARLAGRQPTGTAVAAEPTLG